MIDKTRIKEHMDVVGSDGQHVGTVDRLEGERIKLTRSDPAAGGKHHYIGLDMVDAVEGGEVCLNSTAEQTRQAWQ